MIVELNQLDWWVGLYLTSARCNMLGGIVIALEECRYGYEYNIDGKIKYASSIEDAKAKIERYRKNRYNELYTLIPQHNESV